jgi:aromatic-amino-acid transaminase
MTTHLIASHQGRPSDDPIFALNSEATARQNSGESIINATVGALMGDDGKLAILPSAARAVREVSEADWAAYAPIAGTPDFLRAVIGDAFAGHAALQGCAVASATPGGTGALRHAIGNYLEAGQALLTTSFFWGPYQTLADECERRVKTFAMFEAKAGGEVGGFDVSALDRALGETLAEQGRALIFINDPCHNPTGYSMSASEWSDVAACLSAHGRRAPVTVLLDTAYSAYAATDPREHLGVLEPIVDHVGVLVAWSASKAFTHYGLRVGALIALEPDARDRAMTEAALSYSCRGTWSNCSRGGLRAITQLLTDESLSASVTRERENLKALLTTRVEAFNRDARGAGLRYPRYEGGFFVTVFHDDPQRKAAQMRERGVFVVPQKGALRVALCGVAARDVPRLIEALAD